MGLGSLKGRVPDTPGSLEPHLSFFLAASHRTDTMHRGRLRKRQKTKPAAGEFRLRSERPEAVTKKPAPSRTGAGLSERRPSAVRAQPAFAVQHLVRSISSHHPKFLCSGQVTHEWAFDFSSKLVSLKDFQACHTSHLATSARKGCQPTGSHSSPREAEEEKFLANK